ncbi:hypothetical protein SISNIDRAFT_459467 [Sistotremastrum niveocremeum HHB9708]|uniref:FAD-binding domain-containing protein n=1 Tax=Sistotremastrum niveocremeum HHB9708 TaxID=1314777 RepID=A0A164PLB7_9AGAM|nr:hypothetical protein SISNIDRAFT_459467 [Sistotremastrum niveocremeum HHB9708]
MSSPSTSKVDVLIVGAGPAGLVSAVALSRLHIPFRIVERRHKGELAGRADGIQPRTLEILSSLGLSAPFLAHGSQIHRMVTYMPLPTESGIALVGQSINIPIDEPRFPFETVLPIEKFEEILQEDLLENGHVIDRGTVPTDLKISESTDEEYPIEIEIRHTTSENSNTSNVTEVVRAKYVIGADGAHSWVRKEIGIEMIGEQTPHRWGVMDFTPDRGTTFPTTRAKNIIQAHEGPGGVLGWIPRPGGQARIYVAFGPPPPPPTPVEQETVNGTSTTGSDGDDIVGLDDTDARTMIEGAMSTGFGNFSVLVKDVTWASIYRVAQRVASKYSHQDRIFIVGDACHTHSPNSGQGANASIGDAYNLAWKLALALRHKSPQAQNILSTYESERRPLALDLIAYDKEMFKLFKPELSTPIEYQRLWERGMGFSSGVGITYGPSALCIAPKENATFRFTDLVGYRLPPAHVVRASDWQPVHIHDVVPFNGNFTLIVFLVENLKSGFDSIQNVWMKYGRWIDTVLVKKGEKEEFFFEDDAYLMEPAFDGNRLYLDTPSRPGSSIGEGIYETFGVDSKADAPVGVIVRPDGYIGAMIELDEGNTDLRDYFTGILG